MRKRKLVTKALSILLCTALLSASFDGAFVSVNVNAATISDNTVPVEDVLVSDTDADEVQEQESSVREESVQEESAQTNQMPMLEGDTSVDAGEEAKSQEQDVEEAAQEQESEEISVEEEVVSPQREVTDTTLVSELVSDATLRIELLKMYNAQESALLMENEFQKQHLAKLKEIDLSGAFSNIKNCDGIGYADSASKIDLSGTNITKIADAEFNDNGLLETIVLPDTVIGLGNDAFKGCTALENVHVKVNGAVVSENTLPTGLVSYEMGSNIFRGCTSLKSFKLPDLVTGAALQDAVGMFTECTGLKTVTISKNITVIPNRAFYGAGTAGTEETKEFETGMEVIFEQGSMLDRINDSAFQYTNMKTMDLGNCTRLISIGNSCFSVADYTTVSNPKKSEIQLQTVILPDTIQTNGMVIDKNAFFMTPIKSMYMKSQGDESKVVIPDYVKSLGEGAFYGNKDMTKLQLSANLEAINRHTFDGCEALESVEQSLVNGNCQIKYIGDAAFRDTRSLQNADFVGKMNQLKYIGEQILTETEDRDIPTPDYFKLDQKGYGSDVFRRSAIESLVLPASLREIRSRSFYVNKEEMERAESKLQSVRWETDTNLAPGEEFVIHSEAFARCILLQSFIYPETEGKQAEVTIGNRAFAYCALLTEFCEEGETINSLPTSLKRLGVTAFGGCVLMKSMKIENREDGTAPELCENVFEKCYSLTTVELPSMMTVIPRWFFYDCGLTSFPAFANGVNNIEKIDEHAFFGNKMETVDLSKLTKLKEIGKYCFAYFDTTQNPNYYADEVGPENLYAGAPLKKLILPQAAPENKMIWGSNMFLGADSFETLATTAYNKDGVVYIPDYVAQSDCGTGVFASTGVKQVHWAYTDSITAENKWNAIPDGMFAGSDIANLKDACIPEEDLEKIGFLAYSCCEGLKTVDLSVYPNLETMGNAAFARTMGVESVIFPSNGKMTKVPDFTFLMGNFENNIGIELFCSMDDSKLSSIDFGGVTEIGKWAFASTDYSFDNKKNRDSQLKKLDFSQTNVTKIEDHAFRAQGKLETLLLDGVDRIGESAFQECSSLNMTNTPMADSVTFIGKKAFFKNTSLGKVTFGAGILEIGDEAFAESALIDEEKKEMERNAGLTAVDFTAAKDLVKLGTKAFYKTALKDFDLTATAVKEFKDGTISSCPYLQSAKFGERLQKINGNAMHGCVSLDDISFWSTTTVEKAAFKNEGYFEDPDGSAGKYTPITTATFNVQPVKLNVGLGRAMKFPYYVSKYEDDSAQFSEMHIGNAENTDASIVEYVKVMANTSGYYLNKMEDANRITDSRYFEQVTDLSRMKYSVNDVNVLTFEIEGLKVTPENETVPFTVTNTMKFEKGDNVITKTFSTNYEMKVMDIPYCAYLYSDRDRIVPLQGVNVDAQTGIGNGETTLRVDNKNSDGNLSFFYDIRNTVESNYQPESGNLVIKTNNPNVIKCWRGADQIDDFTWMVKAEYNNDRDANVSEITKGKEVTLRAEGQGDAIVTIYPEKCPQKAITWKVHVKVDVREVELSVPDEYRDGVQPNSQFSIVNKIKMYKDKEVSREKDNLSELSKYTDNKIVYTSDKPDVASIDSNGVVTIKKVTTEKVPVTFTAAIAFENGEKLEKTLNFDVVYPELSNDKEVTDAAGTVVKVTNTGDNPEVTYIKPAGTTTAVSIPSTMLVNGVVCKVTKVDENAFKGNKAIKSVTLGSGITAIPNELFKGCSNLTTVTLKGKITEIGESAFEGCTSLKKISIPKTVTVIKKRAFYNCKKLTTVTFASASSSKLTTIEEAAFQKCAALTKISIPKKVQTIGNKAFYGCKKLKKVTFNSKAYLQTIGTAAFGTCTSLKSITVPYKVTTIGSKTFYKCSKLKTITVKSKKITEVGANAFKGIYKKAKIKVPSSKKNDYKELFSKKGQNKNVKIQ